MRKTGFVLGKFYPPHLGHQLLINFAADYVDCLYVVVGTLSTETIDGALRFQWMQQLFPHLNVLHLDKDLPQYPEEHPDFWNIWKTNLQAILPEKVDYVFASENYGKPLADCMGCSFVPVDIDRSTIAISATQIRNNPLGNWEYIPQVVRPYFCKKICIFGPESCGKTTLTKQLATHFDGGLVQEYARFYLEYLGRDPQYDDFVKIARGQKALEAAVVQSGKALVFCDTDLLTTSIWSQWLSGACDPYILDTARQQQYDLYLLLSPDVPWQADSVRYLPKERWSFFEQCKSVLEAEGRPYVVIQGTWEERWQFALKAVQDCIEGS